MNLQVVCIFYNYRISSYSFRGNYSFLNLEIVGNQLALRLLGGSGYAHHISVIDLPKSRAAKATLAALAPTAHIRVSCAQIVKTTR